MKRLLMLMPLVLSACGFEIVDEGNRGIKKTLGEVQDKVYAPGIYFYNPFISGISEFEVREQKSEQDAQCYTKDTQTVVIKFVATYYAKPEAVITLFKQYGWEWQEKAVMPAIQARIKDVVGQYAADDLVNKRERATSEAFDHLKALLGDRGVALGSLSFVNMDFNDEYERAVEQKVVAIQKASEAKNHTVEVEEQAKQTVLAAKADAEAMRIKSQALSQNKGLVQFEAVQKWDGKLPVNMYGSAPIPFLNLRGE
jgi:regulator of protease activity HflC (stomatin/prohibitin superfamily)